MATTPLTEVIAVPASTSKHYVYLEDREEIKRVFDSFDANGDGKISLTELRDVLKAIGSSFSDEEIRNVMDDLDTDGDGFISLSEFTAFCQSGSTEDGCLSELREAFELYDQNKNGLISVNELHLVLNRLGMKFSMEDCERMIKSVDSDGDGNVSFAEFEKMMSHGNGNFSSRASKNGV